ncbi:hypothetical protein AB0368_26560 [Actinoplanes sp. NPDC051475]|uniref:hypothetical protein n=1 Tax=Actinoplanes sp. NPDC051475 TaxID=3157225 RepID=UPI00344BC952
MSGFSPTVAMLTGLAWLFILFALTVLPRNTSGGLRVRAWMLNAGALTQLPLAIVVWQSHDGGILWALAIVAFAAWLRHRARRSYRLALEAPP